MAKALIFAALLASAAVIVVAFWLSGRESSQATPLQGFNAPFVFGRFDFNRVCRHFSARAAIHQVHLFYAQAD